MITELTPEQEALMYAVRDEYIEKAYTYVEPDHAKVTEWLSWLYKLAKLDPPEVVVVDNHDEVGKWLAGLTLAPAEIAVRKAVWGNVGTELRDKVAETVNDTVRQVVGRAISEAAPYLAHRAAYGNYSDFEWVAAQDFYTRVGVVDNENFIKYKQLCDLGIYDAFQYEGLCIVVKQPLSVKNARKERLERLQLKTDLIEADKHLKAFIDKHTGGV